MNFKVSILYYLIQFRVINWFFRFNMSALRKRRIQKLIHSLQKSPFYNRILSNKKSISDFPVINKKIFMENFDEINTCGLDIEQAYEIAVKAEESRNFSPMIGDITVGLSSGTSGNRGIFLASTGERARWVACILDRVIGFSLKKRKVAFFLRANSNLYSAVNSAFIEFHYFDLLTPVDTNLKKLAQIKPDILVSPPSMLKEIAWAIENGRYAVNPSRIISVAEILTPEDNQYFTKVFNQVIHQVYQCTEGFLASTCKEGTLHFNEDFLVIEKKFLDDTFTRFHPVITDLLRRSQPVVRYELDDIIVAKPKCTCGSTMLAIERIEGRSDDILEFISEDKMIAKIFPDFFRRAIITSSDSIREYALTQKTENELQLFIQPWKQNIYEKVVGSIQDLLHSYKINDVTILRSDTNPHQIGQKLRRIKNEKHKTNQS